MKVKGITISQKISVYKFDRVLNIPLYMTEKRGLGLSIATDDNKISVSGIFSGNGRIQEVQGLQAFTFSVVTVNDEHRKPGFKIKCRG